MEKEKVIEILQDTKFLLYRLRNYLDDQIDGIKNEEFRMEELIEKLKQEDTKHE